MADWLFYVVGMRTCTACSGGDHACSRCEGTGKESKWVELGYALQNTKEFTDCIDEMTWHILTHHQEKEDDNGD